MSARLRIAAGAAIAFHALILAAVIGLAKPAYFVGSDFITFWSASQLALGGEAVKSYDNATMFRIEQALVPGIEFPFAWFYPPTFLLLAAPLSILPFVASYLTFLAASGAAYVAAFRRIIGGMDALLCLAGFSALWINIAHGQNALLTAALAAGALLLLESRPVLAGVLVGLLAIKPHLAVLFPLAFLAVGAWRAIAAAALTAAVFAAASLALLGWDLLPAFLQNLGVARLFVEGGLLPWSKMPTVFAACRLAGMPVDAAYALHAVAAVAAALVTWRIWRRGAPQPMKNAALMCATFFVSPYVFDYDLAWLAFPLAWLAVAALRDGWLPWERPVMVLAWATPALMMVTGAIAPVQIGPFVLGGLLWLIWRRASRPAA
jgi:hypothetical protein